MELWNTLKYLPGDIKLKKMEAEVRRDSEKYHCNEEIEWTDEDEQFMHEMALMKAGKWDFVNDCPKGELDEEDRKRLSGNSKIWGSQENIISENR